MDVIGRTNPPLAHWSVQKTIEDMDKGGVATSITSPTAPQVIPLGKPVAVKIARESNEYAKKMESDHKGRFGTFAMLPLPHIDESLKEIAYAFDTLKVDGVGMMTNYGDKWLGYSYFNPIWEELNRRKATIYTHPNDASCCVNLVQGVPQSAIEWGTDTTRSIANLIFSGSSQKYPDINWIFSHGGGALVSFSERFLIQMVSTPPYKGKFTRESVEKELHRFHYDTAQVANSVALGALSKLVPLSQIVYGTDFPYRTAADHTKGLTAFFNPRRPQEGRPRQRAAPAAAVNGLSDRRCRQRAPGSCSGSQKSASAGMIPAGGIVLIVSGSLRNPEPFMGGIG